MTKNWCFFIQFFDENGKFFWFFFNFLSQGIWRFYCWIMRIFEKNDRVDPINFDRFWEKSQMLEPNEDSTFWRIWRFGAFLSTRVWQIIVLNYDFFFKKNCNFRILNTITRFYKGMTLKICDTLDDLEQNLYFLLNFLY